MPDLAEPATWTTVTFGDVVNYIKDRVPDVANCGLTEYIRGEHFEPANLRLIGRSKLGDGKHGSAFCMRFQLGDVLYVSRNPQLRKAAVADFEGICANTTYVCRANEEYLLQELLPFIMQTESFVEYTVRHKRGSTNFYLNWSDIAGYEFTLPPLEEQRRIAVMLQLTTCHINRLVMLREAAFKTVASAGSKSYAAIRDDYPSVRLAEVCLKKPQSGIYKSEKYRGRGTLMVNMGELFGNNIITSELEMERIELDEKELGRYMLTPDDLLFGRRSMVLEGAGRCVLVGEHNEPMVVESSVLRVTLDPDKVDNRFVFEWFRSPLGHQQIRRIVTFTTVSGVAGSDVACLPVPLPPLEIQKRIANRLSELRNKIDIPNERIEEARALANVLLNQVLEAS